METLTSPSQTRTVASFRTYTEAERAVEQLADEGFPVERVAIVGDELQYVESVTGRATYGSAALRGVIAGGGTGLLFGFIFGLFNVITPLVSALLLAFYGLLFGAVAGVIFGLIGHAVTGKRRGFDSLVRTAARRYDIIVDEDAADRAAAIIDRPLTPRL